MDATAKLLAIIAVAAFATERVLAGVSYVMNAMRFSRVRSGSAVQLRSRERRKLVLAMIAAVIAYVVVDRANLRLLQVMQIDDVQPLVDRWLTWLVVFAGADRVHSLLGSSSGGGSASSDRSETPVVRVQVDGGEIRELHRAS
jgi:uncharacterized membrane protein YgcG